MPSEERRRRRGTRRARRTSGVNGLDGTHGVNGVNGAVRGFPPAAKVLMNGDGPMSPEMKAAGALKMPGLSPLKITPRAGG